MECYPLPMLLVVILLLGLQASRTLLPAHFERKRHDAIQAGGVAPRGHLPATMQWDPTELSDNWWLPVLPPRGLSSARTCAALPADAPVIFLIPPYTGQTNNRLIERTHALATLVGLQTPSALVVSRRQMITFASHFDMDKAVRSWACQITPEEVGNRSGPTYAAAGKSFFYSGWGQPTFWQFHGTVLAQMLLRPVQVLRDVVEQFRSRHGLDETGYVSIHLRWLKGANMTCLGHQRRIFAGLVDIKLPSGRGTEATDICNMTAEYVGAWLEVFGVNANNVPLVVASDKEETHRLEVLRAAFPRVILASEAYSPLAAGSHPAGSAAHNSGIHGSNPSALLKPKAQVLVDMLLMLNGTYFLGNPASTMAVNIAAAREQLLWQRPSAEQLPPLHNIVPRLTTSPAGAKDLALSPYSLPRGPAAD